MNTTNHRPAHPATLFHFSEDPSIARFEPRSLPARDDPYSAPRPSEPLVWAIDEARAPLYFFPRDCPRVAFWAGPGTTPDDRDRFLGHTTAARVIAIEGDWLDRVRDARLYVYHLPGAGFVPHDENAGYYVSREAVTPRAVEPAGDLLARLAVAGVELRITPSLWPLRHALVASSLGFSMIRLRNAAPEGATSDERRAGNNARPTARSYN